MKQNFYLHALLGALNFLFLKAAYQATFKYYNK